MVRTPTGTDGDDMEEAEQRKDKSRRKNLDVPSHQNALNDRFQVYTAPSLLPLSSRARMDVYLLRCGEKCCEVL